MISSVPPRLKGLLLLLATILEMNFFLSTHVAIAQAVGVSAPQAIPLFRQVDSDFAEQAKPQVPVGVLRLLTDANFPPFSYTDANGQAAGLSVDLALTACGELKISCAVDVLPFEQLLPALLEKRGDVIISGFKLNSALLQQTTMTRPYFWSFGRFVLRRDQLKPDMTLGSLNQMKIGVTKGSTHQAWLQRFYPQATLQEFGSDFDALATLRTSAIDAVFMDDLKLAFWLEGSDSAGCCVALGGPIMSRPSFTHNMVFLVRADDQPVAKALDYALDRAQAMGTTAKLMQRYVPLSFW